MEKHKTTLACGAVLLIAVISTGWFLYWRSERESWQGNQMKNAIILGLRLTEYHHHHGQYPVRLSDIADQGLIPRDEFEQLRFRKSPYAEPEDWLYHSPNSLTEIAIVAPHWIERDNNRYSDAKPMASADGGGRLIWRSKQYSIPEWAIEEGEQVADGNPH